MLSQYFYQHLQPSYVVILGFAVLSFSSFKPTVYKKSYDTLRLV